MTRHRLFVAALAGCATLTLVGRASAGETITVVTVTPTSFAKKWDDYPWHAWALNSGRCLTFYQGQKRSALSFWGFRQSPGSVVEMIVGNTDPIKQGVVEVSLNDSPKFRKRASIDRFGDYDAYVIPYQGDAFSIFPKTLSVDVYVDGQDFTSAVSNQMRNVEKVMAKCLEWQRGH